METIRRKTLLYKSGVEYADFSLNHVAGCAHGCKYPCYAYMMKKRAGMVRSYEEWCQPKLVSNAMDLLEKEIPRFRNQIRWVHMCFSTDPFMYGQTEVCDLSLRIIERLNRSEIRCTVLTKGILPKEIATKGFSSENEYGISLVSLDEDFRKKYEPNSASYAERVMALRALHDKGLKTWVSIEPYPVPTLARQEVDDLLDKISFVDRVVFGRLNYNSAVSEFKGYRDYYDLMAKKAIRFCQTRGIECHVKTGTLLPLAE